MVVTKLLFLQRKRRLYPYNYCIYLDAKTIAALKKEEVWIDAGEIYEKYRA